MAGTAKAKTKAKRRAKAKAKANASPGRRRSRPPLKKSRRRHHPRPSASICGSQSLPPILRSAAASAWALPREVTVSEWADENRVLDPRTSAEPGRWRTERTPYLRGIMDAFSESVVERITVEASTQLGKTEGAILNPLAYAVDQDPGPALVVRPRAPDCEDFSTNRLRPMLESTAALRRHLPAGARDLKKMELSLDRMTIWLAGSNSPADLAARPVRYLFLDEIDKFPRFSGREADPVNLAIERTRTYWNRKICECSTPTTREGYIHRSWEASLKHRYHVPCPHCGAYQVLVFAQIKVGEGERNAEKIRADRLAWYECVECHAKITDLDKPAMLLKGVWVPEGATVKPDGTLADVPPGAESASHVGFHLWAAYSPWLTFSEIIAEFFKAKDRPESLMNFVNSWLAEIWEEKVEEAKPDVLRERNVAGYAEGIVPEGALVLTAGVDVHKRWMQYVIRGWGVDWESWLVRIGIVGSWEELIAQLVGTQYPRAGREETLSVSLACVDSRYDTDNVYGFCRPRRDVFRPIAGRDHLAGAPYYPNKLDRNARGELIPGGLMLWHVDTSYYKDKIARLVGAPPGEAGGWHLFSTPPEQYFTEFCAERKIIIRDRKKGTAREAWQPMQPDQANHYLDCEVYAAAAADMRGVSRLRLGAGPAVFKPGPQKPPIVKRRPFRRQY